MYHLSAEDTVLQSAVHLAVNAQFGATALRNLVDLALLAQVKEVDWPVVVQRARR